MDTTRATRREWLGLAVLALPTLLLSLDVSVLYLALPRLSADLGADSTQQLWILDIYSFMLAGTPLSALNEVMIVPTPASPSTLPAAAWFSSGDTEYPERCGTRRS